ncbi:unnamed protein product [Linum trigynum]
MMAAAGVMAEVGDGNYHLICSDGGGGDVETAVQLKQSLTYDLINIVPSGGDMEGQPYCSWRKWNGLQMYGFAYCAMSDMNDAVAACHGCLSIAGGILIDGCKSTGSGHVIGEHDRCYIWVGFGGCPAG